MTYTKGELYRIVPKNEWATVEHLLTGVGACIHGGRWNAKHCQTRIVYTSQHIETAVAERLYYARQLAVASTIERAVPVLPADFWDDFVLGTITISLPSIDMTNMRVVRRLRKESPVIPRLMTEEWRAESTLRETVVQALGRAAADIGIPSVLVPSARRVGYKNQLVFPKNVAAEHRFEVVSIGSLPTRYRLLA